MTVLRAEGRSLTCALAIHPPGVIEYAGKKGTPHPPGCPANRGLLTVFFPECEVVPQRDCELSWACQNRRRPATVPVSPSPGNASGGKMPLFARVRAMSWLRSAEPQATIL